MKYPFYRAASPIKRNNLLKLFAWKAKVLDPANGKINRCGAPAQRSPKITATAKPYRVSGLVQPGGRRHPFVGQRPGASGAADIVIFRVQLVF